MKKTLLVLIALVTLLTISGCGNKTTKVSNGKEVIMSIGKTKLTKEQFYKSLVDYDKGDVIQKLALEELADLEIEVTEEMKNNAQAEIQALKDKGDYESTLEAYGMDDDEYYEYLISSAKNDALYDAYINDNFDTLFENNKPYKARLIYIEVGEDKDGASNKADEALAAIKEGQSFEKVADKYSDKKDLAKETYYTRNTTTDSNVLSFVLDGGNLSDKVTSSDGKGFYIVQVTERNVEALKAEFIENLKKGTTIYEDTIHYFAQKHKFALYDYKVYGYFKDNYPEFLNK